MKEAEGGIIISLSTPQGTPCVQGEGAGAVQKASLGCHFWRSRLEGSQQGDTGRALLRELGLQAQGTPAGDTQLCQDSSSEWGEMAKGSQLCPTGAGPAPASSHPGEPPVAPRAPQDRGESSPAAGAAQGSAFPLRQKLFMTREDFGTDNPQSPILSSRDNVML